MRSLGVAVLALGGLAAAAAFGGDVGAAGRRALAPQPPRVVQASKHDTSRPLREVRPVPTTRPATRERESEIPPHQPSSTSSASAPDAVVQAEAPQAPMPAPSRSFEGLGNVDGSTPPDMNGDVGPDHYVEVVNASFAVYDKTGTKLYGPAGINTLWSGFGGLCETTNEGDPIVQYDQLADRWVITQLAFDRTLAGDPVGPYFECVAVSTTSDPTGSYHRYAFPLDATRLADSPKLGVWPDAYYMTVDQFDDACGGCFVGAAAIAFDRGEMLDGQDASLVYKDLGVSYYGMLPADLHGSTPPPAGAPAPFVQIDDDAWIGYPHDQLELWSFDVDWAAPQDATFTNDGMLVTAAFDSSMCGYARTCVRQLGTTQRIDAVSDRLMYRLAYRRFSDRESLVVDHTVDVNGADRGGVRWYELTRTTGSWGIRQQGTYAPADGNTRWIGSAAMDGSGNLAVGYSVSGPGTYPSIRYAGRLAGSPLGQLPQGETTLQAGGGSQTGGARWGDHSSLSVDPSDDCTFWYVNEYYPASDPDGWHTRVGSFTFPSCGPPPTIDAFAPPSGTPGTSVGITGTNLNGATAVKFAGTSASFTVDSATHVTATVPGGAADGPISVVTPRGTAASATAFDVIPIPTLSSFGPLSGPVGTLVTLFGTNLSEIGTVAFGGVPSSFTVVSPTQLRATVPPAARTGKITATSAGGTATSAATFKVLPRITSFSPPGGAAGVSVTITGSGFTDVSAVKFNGVAASGVTVDSETQITAVVPAGGTTGKISVVTAGGTATSAASFGVVPTISGFAPGSAAPGTFVVVDGTGFGGVTSVKVNGIRAVFAILSKTQLRLTVPMIATTGTLAITTVGGTATSPGTLFVTPRVVSFTPVAAPVGAKVTIAGNAFAGATSVLFDGVLAVPATVTATTITVFVPAAAETGKLTVVTPSGTGQSAAAFRVLPRIASFGPPSGPVGTTVTITGSGFTDVSAVRFNGVAASSPSVDSSGQITAVVPAGATSGKITVVTAGGAALSPASFTVTP